MTTPEERDRDRAMLETHPIDVTGIRLLVDCPSCGTSQAIVTHEMVALCLSCRTLRACNMEGMAITRFTYDEADDEADDEKGGEGA